MDFFFFSDDVVVRRGFFGLSGSFCKKKGSFLWEKEEVSGVVCVFLRFKCP